MSPKPLSPNSPKLRRHRYETWVGGPKKANGGRSIIAEGRFVTYDGAKAWADENYPNAEVVMVTSYAASRGWQAQHVGRRKNGMWST